MNKLSEEIREHAFPLQAKRLEWADAVQQLEQQLAENEKLLNKYDAENQRLQKALIEAENWIKRYEEQGRGNKYKHIEEMLYGDAVKPPMLEENQRLEQQLAELRQNYYEVCEQRNKQMQDKQHLLAVIEEWRQENKRLRQQLENENK